jgi:hypothetical protein
MPFTQTPVNYAEQYSRELANAYPYLSYYGDLWNQGESVRFRPLRGKTVYIPSMTTSGSRPVNRDRIDGVFNRNWNLDYQAVDLDMDREWDTLVDPMDMAQTDEVATIANVTRTFNEFQKIPEQDAYMSAHLADFAIGFGGTDSTTLTAENILATWDSYLAYMTNQRVNRDRLSVKMTPDVYKLLKEAAGITRFVDTGDGFRGVDRNIARLDGVRIEEVPADMMQTEYDFSDGWATVAGSQTINMLFYNPDSIAAPIVYDVSMISAPTAQSKGKWLYYERYYYGVFALNQRRAGVFANIGGTRALGALAVASVAGAAAGESVVTVNSNMFGIGGSVPAGLDLVYTTGSAAVTLTYGAVLPAGSVWVKSYNGKITLTGATAGNYITVALVNAQTGKVVAGGNAVLVVGA